MGRAQAAFRGRSVLPAAPRPPSRWRAFSRNPTSVAGAIVVLAFALMAACAHWLAPYSMEEMHMAERSIPPSLTHLFGTDQFGRDVLSRTIYGGRISLLVGTLSVGVAATMGITVGTIAGFWGGWWDDGFMRITDILMAFPDIVLAIGLIAILGAHFGDLIVVIGFTRVPDFARLSRAQTLLLRRQEYVLAAEAVGLRRFQILIRHILPNASAPLLVLASLAMAGAINSEAALSFLGIGVQPPLASWGTMVADGRRFVLTAPWMPAFPGVAISLAILGFNLIGDGLRDVFDPRHTH
jgi:peptide/nickel transport system permease protein